ncbi:MAG: hypothetical protein QXW97_02540 [Candidatus Pacearchaeota archaeon]
MKKKRTLIILFFVFLVSIILFVKITCSQNIFYSLNSKNELKSINLRGPLDINPDTGNIQATEQLDKIAQTFSNEDESREYLKKGWTKIISKSEYFRPFISFYLKISPVIDPISKYTIGMEPNLSWFYFLSLVIFIAITIYTFRVTKIFGINSPYLHFGIIILVILLVSISGISQKIAEKIIDAISLTKIWYVQLIIVTAVILGFITASIISKSIQELIINWKEELDKEKEKKNREELSNITEAYRKSLGKI